MTTNERDKKWSEWKKWDGELPDIKCSSIIEFISNDGRRGELPYTEICFGLVGDKFSVKEYRYKIKEPESDMHPDLEWLAEVQVEWCDEYSHAYVNHYNGVPNHVTFNDGQGFTKSQWQVARQQLGLDQPEVTSEEEEAWQAKERELAWNNERQGRAIKKQLGELDALAGCGHKYSAYFKDVRHIDTIDVYRVVSLFECEKHGHPISHAAKKLLLSGSRTGGKDVESDVREAIDTLHRWLEMREEDARA